MKRGMLSFVAVGIAFSAANVFAQTTTTGTTTEPVSLAENSPTENLTTAGARAPGRVVNAARARHIALTNNRLAYQHGVSEEIADDVGTGSAVDSSGSDSLTDALGGLINSGGLGSLAGLLGGGLDLNSLLGGMGTSGTGGTTNPNIPSNLTPEVLQMLQGAGINIDELFPPDDSASGTSKTAQRSQTGSILQDRWPGKTEAVSQTVDEEQSFVDRWKEQMALTFFRNVFTGITAGLSSPQLIENIEDFFRPILRPDTVAADE